MPVGEVERVFLSGTGGPGPEYSGSLNTNTVFILICDQVQEEGLYNATHVRSLTVEMLSG